MCQQPPTEAEERIMRDVMAVYTRVNEDFKLHHNGANLPSIVAILDTRKSAGKALYEMSLEVIARKAKNFRNSNAFRNKLLEWSASLRSSSVSNEMQSSMDGDVVKLWLEGVVDYYKQLLGEQLATLGEEFKGQIEEAKGSRGVLTTTARGFYTGPRQFTDAELADIMERAQLCAKSDLCASPEFVSVLRLIPEFLRSYKICDALARSFTDFVNSATPLTESKHGMFEYIVQDRLRTKEWLFFMFVMLLGSLRLHHMQTAGQLGFLKGSSVTASAPITSVLSEDELSGILRAVTELIRLASSDRATTADTINATSLRYVRAACMINFPPGDMVKQQEEENEAINKVLAERQSVPNLTAAEYAAKPLFSALTRDIPEFITKMEVFMESASIEKAWVTTVMTMQLFRFNPKESHRVAAHSSAAEASDVLGVCSSNMVEYTVSSDVKERESYLFALLVTHLRPLMRQLLLCEPPRAESIAGAVGNEEASASAGPNHENAARNSDVVLTEGQLNARQALAEIAVVVDRIVIPRTSKMRRWNLVGIGQHNITDVRFGEACMRAAVEDVLKEMMTDIVVWTTKPPNLWEKIRSTSESSRTVTDEEARRFFDYLIRTEKCYNALSDSSVTVGRAAAAAGTATAAGVETSLADAVDRSVGILRGYRHQYYMAVKHALTVIYPTNASFALVIPIVNSVHNYLFRQEEAQGSGMAGAGAPGGVPARVAPQAPGGAKTVKKMPPSGAPGRKGGPGGPPRPDALPFVELRTEADLRSALRLSQCITSTDLLFVKYKDALSSRLKHRPPPNRIRDELFDTAKRMLERGALEYLAGAIGEHNDFKKLRAMVDAQTPTYFSAKGNASEADGGTKLVTSVFDWRNWDIFPESEYLVKETEGGSAGASGPHLVDMVNAGPPTQSEPLPFPRDLWAALNEFQSEYQSMHNGKVLRWLSPDQSQSSFTIAFPKDGGRLTTVHGPLLLQQLLLAISQYRREGVSYATLAHRANQLDRVRLERMLGPLVDRDKLLVVVGKEDEEASTQQDQRVALNYDFTRPAHNRNGEFSYWLGCKRTVTAIDNDEQKRIHESRVTVVKTSTIQVMKSVRNISHSDLFSKVSAKVSRKFQLTMLYFKEAIEKLIEQNFIERESDSENGKMYKYKA